MKYVINKLSFILNKQDKKFIYFLFIFSIVISIIETVGISIIMPFIAVASDFTLIQTNQYYSYVYNLFNFSDEIFFVIVFGAGLIGFYIFRSTINLLYLYSLSRFIEGRYHLFAYRLFEKYMGMSYRNFIDKNSSELTKTIITEVGLLTGLMHSAIFIISELFIISFIYSMMLYVNYKITFLLTIFLVLNALFLIKTISSKIKTEGEKREIFQKSFYEIINSTLGNFKLIKLQSHDKEILDKFSKVCYQYVRSNILNSTLSNVPRLFLEALGFGLVVFSITFLVWKYNTNITTFLPIISMFVLGLYRLMPSINRIINGYNSILYNMRSLDIVHKSLLSDTENLKNNKINFTNKIILKNVSFEYNENMPILENIDLTIEKYDKIAFIGESGSGKSTLVDIIIGLYRPLSGSIKIDNTLLSDDNIKSLRNKIGYIPQSVYLFDGTVAQNVSFGFKFDQDRIKKVLSKANILEFLEQQDGIHTKVGEGGIKLSGGQKQRIAIARALYNDPEILVLDEATSALDSATEDKIMDEIYDVSDNKTLIIIAHRLSTIKRCKKVYEIKNKQLIKV